MEPGSSPTSPLSRSSNWIADLVGLVIAVLTLTLPLLVIAHYSAPGAGASPPTRYAWQSSSR